MQDLGMSDMKIGHIQMFVVFPDRGECFWHLENQGGTKTKWAHIRVLSWWLLTSGFLITCPPKREPFHTKWASKSMGQLRKEVCGVPGNQNMCWAQWSLPRIIPASGKWISRNSCNHLFCRFAILDVLDIWNNMPILNMDLEDWVLQDSEGTVNCSCFPCLQQKKLQRHFHSYKLSAGDHEWFVWIAGCGGRK